MTEEEFKSRYRASMLEAYVALLRGGLGQDSVLPLRAFEEIADQRAHQAWLEYMKDQK